MLLAGPVEFSTGDLVLLVLAVALSFLALPMLGGLVAFLLYRRNTPPEEREKRGGLKMFILWTALAFIAEILILSIWGWLTS